LVFWFFGFILVLELKNAGETVKKMKKNENKNEKNGVTPDVRLDTSTFYRIHIDFTITNGISEIRDP